MDEISYMPYIISLQRSSCNHNILINYILEIQCFLKNNVLIEYTLDNIWGTDT